MNELVAAAKAVIDNWDCVSHARLGYYVEELRAAVERAEKQEAVGFDEWAGNNNLSPYGRACSIAAWTAAQEAERERIRARVKLAAISSWSASEVYIGPPFIHLQKFVDRLLEDDDE